MNGEENNPRGFGPRQIFWLIVGLLLIAGFVVWQINRFMQASGISPSQIFNVGQANYAPEIKRVSLADAKAAFDSRSAVFVDVRGADFYQAGHIPGAVNIPLAELEKRSGELDPNLWIITYCSWPQEESSARAAQILAEKGFKKINPVLGGWQAWTRADYPVER